MEEKTRKRVFYLDWLRVLAILAVLVYHSSRFFNMEDWHVKNPTWYPWMEVWNRFAIVWLMPLIFVISGASLFYAVGKGGGGWQGAGKFIRDKALRLLVPVVICAFTHASLQVYLERLTHGQFTGSYFQFLPHYFQGVYDGSDPSSGNFAISGMHLWYLLYLFVFSLLLYPLMRWLRGRGRAILARLADLLALPGAVYALSLPTLLLLILPNPASGVMAEKEAGWSLVVYLWLLFCGFLLFAYERIQESLQRLRWLSLGLALASTTAFLVLTFRLGWPAYGTTRFALVFALRGLGSWCTILAFMGLGRAYLDVRTPFLTYANEAVLPFYILHQTVLLGIGYFVVQWAIPGLLKWAIILLASFAAIMALYEFGVRRFNLMRVLFGMKPLRRAPATQPESAAGRVPTA